MSHHYYRHPICCCASRVKGIGSVGKRRCYRRRESSTSATRIGLDDGMVQHLQSGCNFSIKGPDNRRRHHRVVRAGKRLSELLCEQHIIRHSLQSVLCSRCFSSEYQFRTGNGQGNELLMRALAIKQQ